MLTWQRPCPHSPPGLCEETDLHRLDEDPVRVVSETLQPEHVRFLWRPAHDPQPEPQRCHPHEPSWWYNCNILYKMLEVLESARLMLMG
jgi:hypothetical protein